MAKKQTKGTGPKDITLTDMQAFHSSLDWVELWEDFYLKLGSDGLPFYKSCIKFASAHAHNPLQKKFLCWYIGAAVKCPQKEWAFVEPQGWAEKRATGGWYSDKYTKLAEKEYAAKQSALEKLGLIGQKYTSQFLYQISRMADKLDEAFFGGQMMPGLQFADNIARLQRYYDLKNQLIKMHERAVLTQAKTLGINFENMEGFGQLLQASAALNQGVTDLANNRLANALDQLTAMRLQKAAKYGLPLTAGEEKVIDGKVVKDTTQ